MAVFLLAFGVICFSLPLIRISLRLWSKGFIPFAVISPFLAAESDSKIAAKKAEIARHQRELSKLMIESKREAKAKKYEQEGKMRTVCPCSSPNPAGLPVSSAIGVAQECSSFPIDRTVVGGVLVLGLPLRPFLALQTLPQKSPVCEIEFQLG